MGKEHRVGYIDILRAIACISVIMIHASARYVVSDFGSFNFWVADIFDGISRIGVPLFLMISGALLLDENYVFQKEKHKKHILRLIGFFLFWSVFYCITFDIIGQLVVKHQPVVFRLLILSLITGPAHLWFMYLIVGLYLIVPLLRLWVTDKNKRYVEYFLVLSAFFTFCIPNIIDIACLYHDSFLVLNDVLEDCLQLRYVGGYTAYFLLGWYMHNYALEQKRRMMLYVLGVMGSMVSIVGTYILSVTNGRSVLMYDNLSLNVLFPAAAVFVFIKTRYHSIHRPHCIIESVQKNSFGIYAVHLFWVEALHTVFASLHFQNTLIVIPIVFAIALFMSYLCTVVLRKIPLVKQMV